MSAPRYLLDTRMCLHIARLAPVAVSKRLARLKPGDVGISAITHGELAFGMHTTNRPGDAHLLLKMLLELIPVLPLPERAAELYGELRASLARRGTPMGNNDLWIASHARALEATLVTNHVKEFSRIEGLKVENWARTEA